MIPLQFRRMVEQVVRAMGLNADKWIDWTPTVTQSGAVTVTVTEAKYLLVGKICHVYAKLLVTGSGTGANAILIGGQPTAMQPALIDMPIGIVYVGDTGTQNYWGIVYASTATVWYLYDTNTRAELGANPNVALANTDVIRLQATYRIA